MRTRFLALCLAAGCHAPLPPPQPPRLQGTIVSEGGALGTWQLVPTRGRPVEGVDALDLVDPADPDHVVRLVVAPAETQQLPRGIQERVAPREVEIHIASTGAAQQEVVLSREHCRTLDAILRASGSLVFGSARFDCEVGGGRVHGDLELAAGSASPFARASGFLEASDAALAHVRFELDGNQVDPRGAIVWDHRHPRVVFEIEPLPADASVIGARGNAILHVKSTAAAIHSFEIQPAACRVMHLDRHETGFVRVGTHQHTMWAGTLDVDCATPSGGRLTGKLAVEG